MAHHGSGSPGGPATKSAARRVLLVSGNLSVDVRIRRQLMLMNAQTEVCASGSAALELATDDTFCCVIAPAELPDMTAIALIKSMQQAAPGMPVVVVVEETDLADAVRVMQAGAHAVIESLSLGSGLLQYVAPLTRGN
jgi:DNA-binding NtrC family response regulator